MKKIVSVILSVMMMFTALSALAEVKGSVATDGSTSMEKVIGILGEVFMEEYPKASFAYNPTGSGAGITAALEGRCDIGLSPRRRPSATRRASTPCARKINNSRHSKSPCGRKLSTGGSLAYGMLIFRGFFGTCKPAEPEE